MYEYFINPINELSIKIKYHDKPDYKVPRLEKIPQGDWIDLYAAEDAYIPFGVVVMIPLGVSMQLPKGYEAHMISRSSTFKKWGVMMANSMGLIDESYCGDNDEWLFPAVCVNTKLSDEYSIFMHNYEKQIPKHPILYNDYYHSGLTDEERASDIEIIRRCGHTRLNGYAHASEIHRGDKICQFRIIEKMPRVNFIEVESLNNPDRGGFGSTGAR